MCFIIFCPDKSVYVCELVMVFISKCFYFSYLCIAYCHITLDDVKKATFSHLEKCLRAIQLRMNSNKVKLNPGKKEFMSFEAVKRLEPLLPVYILG